METGRRRRSKDVLAYELPAFCGFKHPGWALGPFCMMPSAATPRGRPCVPRDGANRSIPFQHSTSAYIGCTGCDGAAGSPSILGVGIVLFLTAVAGVRLDCNSPLSVHTSCPKKWICMVRTESLDSHKSGRLIRQYSAAEFRELQTGF